MNVLFMLLRCYRFTVLYFHYYLVVYGNMYCLFITLLIPIICVIMYIFAYSLIAINTGCQKKSLYE